MYGFWRLGFSPAPFDGASCVSNGLEIATSMKLKNDSDERERRDDPRQQLGLATP